ncbi:butyrate kinase [Clostridium sp. DSM 100503]|uniref:butyrate kinase n=1 Tax=Clostridium sp. DSM 100503 TaxID=2963282 RepID=UPI00214A20AF|nr:butyrate kinase [Clostridium sp. DSM 100503]MCR1952130.1 butyrate kinase [Clostridium sp. DSM 100503]
MSYKLLIINPGSTSTKIGVYQDEKEVFVKTLRHSAEEIGKYDSIYNQFLFRKEIIIKALEENNIDVKSLNAIVGRGGMLKPMEGGTYLVNNLMLEDLKVGVQGQHASNLGGIISNEIAKELNVPAYIVDPVVVDELEDVARISGVPELPRVSKFHALNQKAVAKRYGVESGKGYKNLNLIVVHLGGGVSVGAHKNGKVIDVNNALDGDGPFSPERSGSVPIGELIKLCFSGKYTEKEIYSKIVGKGGFVAYLNTNDARELENWVDEGREDAVKYYNAFVYQIAKSIGEMATVLEGKVDRIIVTGGIAYWKKLIVDLNTKVDFIAPIIVYPGEDELLALAQGTLRVLRGEEIAKEYK